MGASRWSGRALAMVAAVALVLSGAATSADAQSTLVSKKVAAAPTVDGQVDDVWKQAKEIKIRLTKGKNFPGGATEVTLRSVYAGDRVYFLAQWKDRTQSYRRSPWVKQKDGSWQMLKDPADKGGDNNTYYEDKAALLWNISSAAFEQKGCQSACHTGQGKPYGNKYTDNEGELLDMWHWKSVRTGPVGQFDDQYVDNTRYDKEKAPDAGRKSDPKTGGGYADNATDDKKGPKYALPGNTPAPPYWIVDSEKVAFEDAAYKAGAEVPSIVVAPFEGDRGDISSAHAYKDGVWALEFSRKLTTGSKYDVQFDDLKKTYAFGIAVFDNAQVRHAYHTGVQKLTFE